MARSHPPVLTPSPGISGYNNVQSGRPTTISQHHPHNNVRGEPVFSVMAAGWFCEMSWLIWESGGCEIGAFQIII